ncbi:HD-GYP domain-containing protein [Lichenicoccus sp.]|uniref:HD-GYP domain-containing protein n=1 Tax=Lichenicoccus sp. TaxID=2781899 RepID=UPI003D12C7CB
MSVFHAPREAILVTTTALSGLLCIAGYLASFAIGRRLHSPGLRPLIGLGDLVKPLAFGMLLGVAILFLGLHGDTASPLLGAPLLLSVLLCVGLAGIGAGGCTAWRGIAGPRVSAHHLVRRLHGAGNSHEDAIAQVAVRLALAAGFDPAYARDLLAAVSLHDIGKAGVPEAILSKERALPTAALAPDEWRLLQNHTRIGFRMLAHSREPMLDLAADIALHHHENWDGSGYPTGLAGEQIPLTSRVVALAETFDRILAVPTEVASLAGSLRARAGTQFDPRLVSLLLADLPGMIAARGAKAGIRPRAPAVAGWQPPASLRPMHPKPMAM